MSKNKLYTAYFAGTQYNANGITCGMIIVTKWKDTTEDSPEIGRKRYYCHNAEKVVANLKNEGWCRSIYENRQENTFIDNAAITKTNNFKERTKALLYNALVLLADTSFNEYTDGQKWLEMVYRELGATEEDLAECGISISKSGEVFYI